MTTFDKNKRIVHQKWTRAAKGQPCKLAIPGVCIDFYPHEKVVACHLPSDQKSMSYKSDDVNSVDGCSMCHSAIDGDWDRCTKGMYNNEDKMFFMLRALQRTNHDRFKRKIVK